MKNIFLFFLLSCLCVSAQDTIRFRNGEVKAVKVSEVGINDVRYTRFDNSDGPKYIVTKNEIHFIKYAGGQIDSFAVANAEISVKEKPVELRQKSGYVDCDKFVIHSNKLFCNGRPIGESRLLKIIPTVTDNAKKNKMLKAYNEMKVHKKKQYIIGFVCLGAGVGAAYFGFVASVISQDITPLAFGSALGVAIGVTGAVISSIHKHKRQEKKLEIARIYNED